MTRKTLFFALLAMTSGAALAHGPGQDKWKSMDTDGNGMVSSAEHAAAATKRFNDMDADHDGFVTATEMDASRAKMGGEHMDKMSSADMIKEMDTDGDGKLSASEHDASAASMFAAMDGNKDGSVSKDEMNAAKAKVQQVAKDHH